MKQINIYLDDIRNPPKELSDYVIARTYDECISLLRSHEVCNISLDHDLACYQADREMTGYDVLLWIEEQIITDPLYFGPDRYHVHSQNPVGQQKMRAAILKIKELRRNKRHPE